MTITITTCKTKCAGVLIDQMISAQPGRLTSACIWTATIFFDHFSRHIHVHLMKDQTQASTLETNAGYVMSIAIALTMAALLKKILEKKRKAVCRR